MRLSEFGTDCVLFSCLQLKKGEPMKYSLHLQQDYRVQNLKPAVVKIYDGYKPSNADTQLHTKPYLYRPWMTSAAAL